MNLAQVRAQYPQYQDLSDKQLADALHEKFYSDIPIQDYYNRIGLTSPKERTWGEAAKDIAAGVVSGAGSLVQLPGQLYGLATGDFSETGALGLGKDIAKYGEEMKSAGLKAREAERAEKIRTAEQKGQWEAFKTAFGETIKDPALLTSFLAEQAPQLLVPFGAAKVAQIGTAAKAAAAAQGLTGTAAKEAVEAVTKEAARRGTAAAVGAGAVQQGADVGAQSYEDIYKELISKGAAEKDAAQGAINLARAAGASGALISLLAQRLPGAKTLEESFAGVRGPGGRLLGAARGALGEGASEIVEETGGKFGANLALREVAPETELTSGLGATAGMAAIGGVGMGGAAGLARRPGRPEAAPAPEAPRTGPLTPEEQAELDRQRAAVERPKTTEELLAGIQTGRPTTLEDIARIKDEHETAVIEGLLAQDAEMKRANDWIAAEMERVNQLDELRNQARDEEERQAIERRILDLGIKDVDQRVRETRILSRVQDLIDRNIPFASTAINDINQKFGVINEAPLTEEERARIENIMGMVNTFTNFVNLPVLAPKPVDRFAENQAMEALIKERTERGPTEPLRAAPPAPSPRIEEAPVSQGVGEGAALRPTGGVEPSAAQDRQLVTPAPVAPPTAAAPSPAEPAAPPVTPPASPDRAAVQNTLNTLNDGDTIVTDDGDRIPVERVVRNKAGDVTAVVTTRIGEEGYTGIDFDGLASLVTPQPYIDSTTGERKFSAPATIEKPKAAAPAAVEVAAPAEKVTPKAGDFVKLTVPGVDGPVGRAGKVEQILPSGDVEVRTQQGEIVSKPAGEVTVVTTAAQKAEAPAPTKVKLYRGVQAGKESQPTVGGGLFLSPDRKVAETYAGEKGTVTEVDADFQNLLDVPKWTDAKEKLGLQKSATMEDIVNKARADGYDGVTFNTTNGREYISIPPTSAVKKVEAPAVETPAADVAQQVKDLREQQTKLLTKSGKVPAPRSPARQKYDVLERQIAELEDRQLAVRSQKPRKRPSTIMGSPMLAGIFNKIGGLHTSLLPEFSTRFFTKRLDKKGRPVIQTRNPLVSGYGTLFNKNGKFDFGEIAEHLEAEGYLEPGSLERDYKDAGERAKELVKRALNGEEVLPIEEQIAKDNFEREASERQKALDRQEENRMIATGELQLEPEFDWSNQQFEENLGLDREFETDLEMYNLEPKDLEFLSDEELESELTDAEREQAQARRTRKAAEDAARQKAEGAAPREDEALLTRPTAEGLKAKQEAAEKAAAEEKKAKAAEQERLRKEQQAKEEKARADETVKDFELGKSAEEQMTGMGDLFAEPPAPPKREPRQGTPKQLETADKIAKPFGATVVYQDGDLALMRGFSKGNGQPVYMAINLPYYFEKDIESLKFPKDLVTPEQRTELIKIKQNLEAEDKIKFDKSPSIKFTDGLATSRNISPEIAGVVRGWKDLLGLKVNLYITTVGDAIADRNRFNGPHRAVGSAGINDREAGVVRKLPNGDYYIAFKISTSKTKMLEVIAHELGHIHEWEVFNRADDATRQQILDEHSKWLKQQTGKTAREFVTALRAKTAGKTTRIGEGMMASEMDSRYWKAFTEWYADQVSRWAVTSEKPVSVVEKFFSRLAQALKSFYSKLKNAGYLPNETFVQYLNKTHQPSDHVITPDEGIAGQMLGEVMPAGTPGQQALETINRMGMGVKPPEPGRIEKAKAYLKEAGENPAATKESAKKTLTKWLDAFETMAFSGDAAFNNKVTSSVIKDMKENPEILGLLLEASQSQAVNADNVVSRGIIEGSIEYNEEMKKWQSVKKDENFSALAKKLDDLAKKYGTSKEEMERIAHTYLVVKRLPGIIQRNNDLDAAIEKEQATAKPDRKRIDEWKALKVYVSPEQMAQVEPGLSLIKTIPELKEVSDIWQGIRENTIKAMVESGLWSPEYATNMFDNIDYVPYFREEQLEEGAGPLEFIRGLQVKSKEFQLKGSGAPVNDVFDNMIRWSQYAMNRAIRAQKARQMIDAAKDIDIGDRKMAVRVTEEKRGMNIVRVFRDGKQELWDMADPMFVPAFSAIQNVSIPMFKWAAKVADVLRNSVVLYPMFSVAQVPQDSFAAMFTSGLKPQHALKIPILAVKEFVKTLSKTSATHNELVKFGVVGARDFSADVMRKDAEIYAGLKPPKGGWGKTKEILEHIAMAADNAVRQAVYEASVDQGLSKAEALEKAFEIFNVRRRGTSKALNLAGQTIPFFYAYLAAQRVAYRTITGVGTSPTERRAALQTLAATSAAVFTLSMLYAMAVGDDKDYEETPAAVRDRTLTIPGTGGVRIPLRTDFFLFPKMIAEHTYLMLTDKGYEDGAKFRRSMRDALVSAVASPTPLPQVIKPALEVAINYDFFTGKPVIGQFEKQKDWERQFNDSTSEFSKLLGKTGLVSPIAADHMIRGMFGSAGGLVMYASNFFTSDPDVPRPELSVKEMLAALPGTSGFLKRPQESALKNDFYTLRDEVEKAVNTFNDIKTRSPQGMEAFLADEKQMARLMLGKPVDKINREIAKIRRQMTIITNMPESQMSAEDKSDNIRQLREIEREMLKSVNVKELRQMAKI